MGEAAEDDPAEPPGQPLPQFAKGEPSPHLVRRKAQPLPGFGAVPGSSVLATVRQPGVSGLGWKEQVTLICFK